MSESPRLWLQKLAKRTSRLYDISRQFIHLDVSIIADDHPLGCIEHEESCGILLMAASSASWSRQVSHLWRGGVGRAEHFQM
jgi:hypothetical protein